MDMRTLAAPQPMRRFDPERALAADFGMAAMPYAALSRRLDFVSALGAQAEERVLGLKRMTILW